MNKKVDDALLGSVMEKLGRKEISAEKEENPDNELFIEKHRVNSMELVNYRRKHVSRWNYNAFQKYVEREIDFIERNY